VIAGLRRSFSEAKSLRPAQAGAFAGVYADYIACVDEGWRLNDKTDPTLTLSDRLRGP
jgi:hypothetical protein